MHKGEFMTKQIDENIYNIRFYPKHLRQIVKILMKHEGGLSDGFEWYAQVSTITAIAQELYDLYNKKKDL